MDITTDFPFQVNIFGYFNINTFNKSMVVLGFNK